MGVKQLNMPWKLTWAYWALKYFPRRLRWPTPKSVRPALLGLMVWVDVYLPNVFPSLKRGWQFPILRGCCRRCSCPGPWRWVPQNWRCFRLPAHRCLSQRDDGVVGGSPAKPWGVGCARPRWRSKTHPIVMGTCSCNPHKFVYGFSTGYFPQKGWFGCAVVRSKIHEALLQRYFKSQDRAMQFDYICGDEGTFRKYRSIPQFPTALLRISPLFWAFCMGVLVISKDQHCTFILWPKPVWPQSETHVEWIGVACIGGGGSRPSSACNC